MRGKPAHRQHHLCPGRITPACAGKTRTTVIRAGGKQDHPRVCGENRYPHLRSARVKGSPPRVRGKQQTPGNAAPGDRITPACAGKTLQCPAFSCCSQDHPRVCGENVTIHSLLSHYIGSPPRVRGKRKNIHVPKYGGGITPACAGKTSVASSISPHQ